MSIDLLRRCRYFEGLDETTLEDAAASGRSWRTAGGEVFFRQGDPAEHFFVLATGHARLSQLTPEGRQVILGMTGPYQEVGIITAIPGATYPIDMQAVQECTAIAWDRAALGTLLEAHPVLALRALRLVSARFVELQDRYRELATERVERRIARALLRLVVQIGRPDGPGVTIAAPLARQDLAELTGTTLFTVSRTLSSWEAAGIISSGRERVTLVDHARLAQIAEELP
jgi:CRP-like cAMP-binding protein